MQTLDARGKSCPLPIVLTAKAVKQMSMGDELLVLADDRAFLPDIEAWCKKTGHELRSTQTKDGCFEATIRRRT
ncbi:MAG TPA: sulfurtransferase TusA family protein [Polyangiaceae bacterium]|nr:sulfurtransferase TusA family protein [Polyangiaceae bacterium]